MLVDRSALSGIAGHYSGHPLRTRSVLADAADTALAVFLWSVERLCRRCGDLPFGQPGKLGIEASLWLTAVCLTRRPCGALPSLSRGFAVYRRWRCRPLWSAGVVLSPPLAAAPRCLQWRGNHSRLAIRQPCSSRSYGESRRTVGRSGRGSSAMCPAVPCCAWRVLPQECARLAGKASPHAGEGIREGPFPSVGA